MVVCHYDIFFFSDPLHLFITAGIKHSGAISPDLISETKIIFTNLSCFFFVLFFVVAFFHVFLVASFCSLKVKCRHRQCLPTLGRVIQAPVKALPLEQAVVVYKTSAPRSPRSGAPAARRQRGVYNKRDRS